MSKMQSSGFDVPNVLGSMERELCRLLDQLDSLLTGMAQDVYCARFATDVSGSIGEHVRHCLRSRLGLTRCRSIDDVVLRSP